MSVSEEFWKNANLYDLGIKWKYKQKLSYDIQRIIPHIRKYNNIADIMCGEASVVKILNDIFTFESVYLCDINESVLFRTLLNTPLNFRGEVCNLNEGIPIEVQESDCCLWLGGINYVVNSSDVLNILSRLNNVIIRTCCYEEQTYINKYSEELGSNYETLYRTKEDIMSMMNKVFKRVKYERLYPNKLESKFGGIQYLFVGENRI
jgi:hypothetical protein